MKCIPEVSASDIGVRCKNCHRGMSVDDSRECKFPNGSTGGGSSAVVAVSSVNPEPVDVCCTPAVKASNVKASGVPCQPVKIPDCKDPGYDRCCKCGYVFVPGEQRERDCTNPGSQKTNQITVSFMASASNYIQAWMKWVASGRKVLGFSGILQRFRICSACDEYNDQLGKCNRCNCFINLLHDGQGMNKLEWATEQCPLKNPKWKKQVADR